MNYFSIINSKLLLKIKQHKVFLIYFLFYFIFLICFILFYFFVIFFCDLVIYLLPFSFLQENFIINKIEWNFFRNFYYFFGFLDYSAISLPEIVDHEMQQDSATYNSMLYFAYLYNILVENLYSFFYKVDVLKPYEFDLDYILKILEINDKFELKSLFADCTEVVFLDPKFGLDKYFMNIGLEGLLKDSWEMKGPQIEYLKSLAFNYYYGCEYMSTITNENLIINKLQVLEDRFWAELFYSDWLTLPLYMDSSMDPWYRGTSMFNSRFDEFFDEDFDDFYSNFFYTEISAAHACNFDSFSMLYKIVKKADRFFFDGFYIYFYFGDFNIMFRVNRYILSEIFSKNLIWGLSEEFKYPFSFAWDYNIYGLHDLFLDKFLKFKKHGHKTWNYVPFGRLIHSWDVFINRRYFLGFFTKNPWERALINENFEWYISLSEFRARGWGRYYERYFYTLNENTVLDFDDAEVNPIHLITDGADLSLDAFTNDKTFVEKDYYSLKMKRKEKYVERAIEKNVHLRPLLRRKHIKPKELF